MIRNLLKNSSSKLGVGFFSIREIRSVNNLDKQKNVLAIANFNNGKKLKKFKLPLNFINEEEKFIYKGKSSNLATSIENTDPEDLVRNEEDLNLYAINENLYHKKIVDEDIQKKKKTKLGIIKKKINKIEGLEEKHVNLLTWDAKEQIKHLHMTDPEIWTVERICESFPITFESCKKLLKSKWAPKTLDELERHDEKVIQNWKMIKELEKNPNSAGPAINIYTEYKRMNKLNLLKNATGLPGINFERNTQIFSDSYAVHESLLCKPGSFSSIVVHKDDFVKKLFGRKTEEAELNKKFEIYKQNDKDLFNNHLIFTRKQLKNIFDKIFVDDKKSK